MIFTTLQSFEVIKIDNKWALMLLYLHASLILFVLFCAKIITPVIYYQVQGYLSLGFSAFSS